MGKRKIGFKKAHSKVDALQNAGSSDDEEAIESHLQSILEDEIDQYTSSKDQALLDKANKKKSKVKGKKPRGAAGSDEEEEVYELGLSSSDEDENEAGRKGADFLQETSEEDDDDDNDDDILGRSDEAFGVPDSRAWGKKARVFHNTDYVDQDFGGFEGSDAENADLEEAEAKEIQKRLMAELDESDFLGLVPAKADKPRKSEKTKEILKVDFDSLSIAEKRKLVQRECPEVIHMLDEYKDKLKEAKIIKEAMGMEEVDFLRSFYQSKYHTLLNYCINISYYLYLRATSPSNCKGHPVIKRILQFRRLLDELAEFNPNKYQAASSMESKLLKKKSKAKKSKKSKRSLNEEGDVEMGQAMDMAKDGEPDDVPESEELEKRRITYAISKNKGLTPKRKREQRNPRVKHREKYRKAKIRRRGQVRTATTEVHRYGGEASGIKSHVTKSIKIK